MYVLVYLSVYIGLRISVWQAPVAEAIKVGEGGLFSAPCTVQFSVIHVCAG